MSSKITSKNDIEIHSHKDGDYNGVVLDRYEILSGDYKISWYYDGYLIIDHVFIKHKSYSNKEMCRLQYNKPDLSVFKKGRLYSGKMVLKFVDKIKKLALFS